MNFAPSMMRPLPQSLITRRPLLVGVLLTLLWLIVYLVTVSPTVNFIDSGELITAVWEPGITHPPGYPLYTLLGYVVTHFPWGEIAWRLNTFSAFWAALAVGSHYFLVVELYKYARVRQVTRQTQQSNKPKRTQARHNPATSGEAIHLEAVSFAALLSAAAVACLLGASASFWSRAVQAKMYSLHFFLISALFFIAIRYRTAYESGQTDKARRWLGLLVLVGTISFTNHLMTNLLVPGLLILVLAGSNWRGRLQSVLHSWQVILPALLPILLYLYLPLRSSQQPYMNWGSPDNWGDFWRHVTAWQFRTYLFADIAGNIDAMKGYPGRQWSWLSVPVIALCLTSFVMLYRLSKQVCLAVGITACITLLFAVAYGISEIEPYLVPIYMMLCTSLGVAAMQLSSASIVRQHTNAAGKGSMPLSQTKGRRIEPAFLAIPAALALLALIAGVLQYPLQDRSRDYMAEKLVQNVFADLPRDSILITDYWDFYAPTYYLQHIKGFRPDVTVIDMSLLRYPFYLQQLRRYAPELISTSQDIVSQFGLVQRKWVSGESLDDNQLNSLNNLYFGLLTSFVERNEVRRPAYVFFSAPCDAPQAPSGCDGALVAPDYSRVPAGLPLKLQKRNTQPTPAIQSKYDLGGITQDPVAFDDAAKLVVQRYARAFRLMARRFELEGAPADAARMTQMAETVEATLRNR